MLSLLTSFRVNRTCSQVYVDWEDIAMFVNYSTAPYFIRLICHLISIAGCISFTSLLPHLPNKNIKDLRM